MTVRGAEGTSRPTRNRASYQITGSIRMTSTEVTMEVDASGSLALQSRLYHFPPPAPSYPVLRLRGWVGRSRGRGRFVDVRERSPPAAHGNTRTSAGATIRAWNQPSVIRRRSGHEKAQGDAPRTARRAYHASSMGGDPPRRPSSR